MKLTPASWISLSCLFLVSAPKALSLSGKVVDAEEGNGLKSVDVSLVNAGLRTVTEKNGTWSLATLSAGPSGRTGSPRTPGGLHLVDGRLGLRLEGKDLLGRRLAPAGTFASHPSAPAGARAAAEAVDTLVFVRDGYVTRRVPLTVVSASGLLDSIRRVRYPQWVDSSHSNGFKPDTADAFPDTLRRLTLRFPKASWNHMMKTMADSCGRFGSQLRCGDWDSKDMVPQGPLVWVPIDLEADGQVWKNVGIRLKGNSSLSFTWSDRIHALPFRLNTDKFEDSLPVTRNQRFHGFKKIALGNAMNDSTLIREALAGDLFRMAGVPAPVASPVRVTLVHGDTVKELGGYTLAEIPDNPLLNRVFGHDSGRLYKPLSDYETFDTADFADPDLVTDYADVRGLHTILHASDRTTNRAAWRRRLDSAFDTRGFLNWLAVSTAICNWDAYGQMAHNYYLFNDKGILRWITWDFGWSFDKGADRMPPNTVWYDASSGGWDEGGEKYPLIDYLLADPVYCEEYRSRMNAVIAPDGPLGAGFEARVDAYAKLVKPIPGSSSGVSDLRSFASKRVPEIKASLQRKTCPTK